MKIGTRFIVGNFVVFGAIFIFSLVWLTRELEPEYRKAVEEPMVDASRILAAIASSTSRNGKLDIESFKHAFEQVKTASFEAKIYEYIKSSVDFRVYITDEKGIVLFDSHRPENVGADFSIWRDVELTLSGSYGARTTRDDPSLPQSSVMYVASPIVLNGKTIGVLSLGKPTDAANIFVERSKRRLIMSGAIICILIFIITYALSQRVVRPISLLTGYARAVRDGKKAPFPKLAQDETAILGNAFEEMREALEGKQYVERYLQAFTHEVKSPLSAIKGALELLKEEVPEDQRSRFIKNMDDETDRINGITEKLLLLSSLENTRSIDIQKGINLRQISEKALSSLSFRCNEKGIIINNDIDPDCHIAGDPFWITHCIINLLNNALDFTRQGGQIHIYSTLDDTGHLILSIRDEGPGVPEYAIEKVHERFFSLRRPATGQKSTGLGLSIVKEAMLLHGGSLTLENLDSGARASLIFPIQG